jgi:hypothetical protein
MIILLYTYHGECDGEINLMLAYAQDVGTELNEVYLQYSFISAVT